MKIKIQTVSVEALLPLRGKILRPNLPPDTWSYPRDFEETTLHLGAFAGEALIGIATFEVDAHADLPAEKPYRLRGMAVETSYQRHGIGRKLVHQGIEDLSRNGCDLLWFNARVKAFPFYESLGFSYHGEIFDVAGVGPHKVMYKYLI
jgi:GNAT superfamily N-acetyltransferase